MNKVEERDLLIKTIGGFYESLAGSVFALSDEDYNRKLAQAILDAGFSFTRGAVGVNPDEFVKLRHEIECLKDENKALRSEKEAAICECAKIAHEREGLREDMEHFKHYGEMAKDENQLLTGKVLAFEFCISELGGKVRI